MFLSLPLRLLLFDESPFVVGHVYEVWRVSIGLSLVKEFIVQTYLAGQDRRPRGQATLVSSSGAVVDSCLFGTQILFSLDCGSPIM
ncbi:hypothetical protein F5146DRAFT_1063995 [Armillaria mellea]|nr:hypothetical protein F5146DRAFT_1063995 [Armillaria mellea]